MRLVLVIAGVVLVAILVALMVIGPGKQPSEQLRDDAVLVETSMGNITIELYPDKAPQTVKNFLEYVDAKHYDSTIFHRVIKDFMIQGGGFTPDLQEKPTRTPIRNESGNGLLNARGSVAMARTSDPHSATAQFYINVVDNPSLDRGRYCVFGKVVEGMEVVDKIRATPTHNKGGAFEDLPVDTVTIKSIRRAPKQ